VLAIRFGAIQVLNLRREFHCIKRLAVTPSVRKCSENDEMEVYISCSSILDRLCGLVVRVLGYRSGGLGSIPGTTRKTSSGSGTKCTQPREYN
jgi:hypothetical protein